MERGGHEESGKGGQKLGERSMRREGKAMTALDPGRQGEVKEGEATWVGKARCGRAEKQGRGGQEGGMLQECLSIKKIALTHGRELCELLLLIGIQLFTSNSSGFERVQNMFRRVQGMPKP